MSCSETVTEEHFFHANRSDRLFSESFHPGSRIVRTIPSHRRPFGWLFPEALAAASRPLRASLVRPSAVTDLIGPERPSVRRTGRRSIGGRQRAVMMGDPGGSAVFLTSWSCKNCLLCAYVNCDFVLLLILYCILQLITMFYSTGDTCTFDMCY